MMENNIILVNLEVKMKTIFFSIFMILFLVSSSQIYAGDSAEERSIITQCTLVWQNYKSAISRGDIEKALEYVSDNSKEQFKFALQSDKRRIVQLGNITTLESLKNNIAEFRTSVEFKLSEVDDIPPGYSVGDSIKSEGYINFIKDSSGKWKIDFY
jgi:hypothetical protein